MTDDPVHLPVPGRIDVLHHADTPEECGNVGDQSTQQCLQRNDRRDERAEADQRKRAVRMLLFFLPDRDEKRQRRHDHAQDEQDDAQIEQGRRGQRGVRGQQRRTIGRFGGGDGMVDHQRRHQHHEVADPGQSGRRKRSAQHQRPTDVKDGHFHEDHPENQQIPGMDAEPLVKGGRIGQADHLPARECHKDGRNAADQQRHDGGQREQLHVALDVPVNAQPGDRARPEALGVIRSGEE